MSLAGRTALITGAGGGIGSAVARAFAAAGADLSLADLKPVAALADELRAQGRRVVDTPTDVTEAAQVGALIQATLKALRKIDVLVNVAGTVSFGAAATLPEAEWERVLAVNLKGTFLCCQAVIAPMRAQKYGRIVNIGSILGKNGGNARPWLDAGEQAQASNVTYRRVESWRARDDDVSRARTRRRRHHGERGGAGPDRIENDREFSAAAARPDSSGAHGHGGRSCAGVPVSGG